MELFKKSEVVGVSVTPGIGLEVAQIDFETRTVLKYGTRSLEYNINQREIVDLDIFKSNLQDLFDELMIAKGSEIVLNIPNVCTKIAEYPASMEEVEISNAIEESLAENYLFNDGDYCYSMTILPSVSMQFNKVIYTAYKRSTVVELIMSIKDLGYKVVTIDTALNSILNSMMYLERVNTAPDTNWLMLVVDSSTCYAISMQGNSYVDIFEERISIGEVLGDAENYATVIKTIEPILKNIPSKYLCVISTTDIISAEALSNKLTYSAPITYQEANCFLKESLVETSPELDDIIGKTLSLEIIGAAINRSFKQYSVAHLNLFNKVLGDIYLSEQPPTIIIFGREIELSNENLIKIFIVCVAAIVLLVMLCLFLIIPAKNKENAEINKLDNKIVQIKQFLDENKNISADMFDEGIEIKTGIVHNKAIYSYYTIVGTEIPQKLWLTYLKLSDKVTIEGQADNLESVYSFFRSIKDYNPEATDVKLQKLGLASKNSTIDNEETDALDSASILTSLNADFYEFRISNEPEIKPEPASDDNNSKANGEMPKLPPLESVKE